MTIALILLIVALGAGLVYLLATKGPVAAPGVSTGSSGSGATDTAGKVAFGALGGALSGAGAALTGSVA